MLVKKLLRLSRDAFQIPPVIADPRQGLPEQPISLRLAYLCSRLSFIGFLNMLILRQQNGEPYLTAYKYVQDAEQPRVYPRYYERILENPRVQDATQKEIFLHLPNDHFVLSNEFNQALNLFSANHPDYVVSGAVGEGVDWNPDVDGVDDRVFDVTIPRTATRQDLRKKATEDRNKAICDAAEIIKKEHPTYTAGMVAKKIVKELSIAKSLQPESVRRILNQSNSPKPAAPHAAKRAKP